MNTKCKGPLKPICGRFCHSLRKIQLCLMNWFQYTQMEMKWILIDIPQLVCAEYLDREWHDTIESDTDDTIKHDRIDMIKCDTEDRRITQNLMFYNQCLYYQRDLDRMTSIPKLDNTYYVDTKTPRSLSQFKKCTFRLVSLICHFDGRWQSSHVMCPKKHPCFWGFWLSQHKPLFLDCSVFLATCLKKKNIFAPGW